MPSRHFLSAAFLHARTEKTCVPFGDPGSGALMSSSTPAPGGGIEPSLAALSRCPGRRRRRRPLLPSAARPAREAPRALRGGGARAAGPHRLRLARAGGERVPGCGVSQIHLSCRPPGARADDGRRGGRAAGLQSCGLSRIRLSAGLGQGERVTCFYAAAGGHLDV